MPNSTTRLKVSKPRPDFPLFPHASGRWAKKVKGTLLYFGPTASDPHGDDALTTWLAEKDYVLLKGRRPAKTKGQLTVADLANKVLNIKRLKVENKELSIYTFDNWRKICAITVDQFGGGRHVESLEPDDFEKLFRDKISGLAVTSRAAFVGLIRTLFHFAYNDNQRLIDRPVMFGEIFRSPRLDYGPDRMLDTAKTFSAEEIRQLLSHVRHPARAFVLLGINCGFGNTDCAALTVRTLDMDKGWHTEPRQKTGQPRRCPLWPETIEAIQRSLKFRASPADSADADLVFITRTGRPYVRLSTASAAAWKAKTASPMNCQNAITGTFWKAFTALNLNTNGRSFYSLRHTFETVAGNARDQVAVDYIMGHKTPGMGTRYRHAIDDERLLAVVNHVHNWLFPASSVG